MKYDYISVFSLVGGYSISSDSDEYELLSDETMQALLTKRVDEHCSNLDRANAIAHLMLKGVFRSFEYSDFDTALNDEIKSVQDHRKQLLSANLALVIKFTGDVDLNLTGPKREREDLVIVFDAVDKNAIMATHASAIQAIVTSVCVEAKSDCNARNVAKGVYFFDEKNRPLYSYTAAFGGMRAYVSSQLKLENAKSISNRAERMLRLTELEKVFRLYVEMLEYVDDQFRAFIFGWTALEILVNKTFKRYEQQFLRELQSDHPSSERYLQRVQNVMQDKYRLSDKFNIIAGILAEKSSFEEDIRRFEQVKNIRDKILHGEPVREDSLPVSELQALLSKYLELHISGS